MRLSLRIAFLLLLAASLPSVASGEIRTRTGITIPQHGGGPNLTANLYAPDVALAAGPYPVISMLPGGGAGLSSTEWAAQRLARDGYVVALILPEASTDSSYANACISGLNFLASGANEFFEESDNSKAGIAGWSLGGRSLTKVQEEDTRVKCLVAWDNLAVSEKGDGGSPLGSNRPQLQRRPRVPAMGQASLNGFTSSESKITAWKWWREHDQPAMAVVFENSNHFWWSGSGSTTLKRDQSHHYTLAWFDRWLKNDPSASSRLLATSVVGAPVSSLLSSGLRSAAYFDGLDTSDLKAHLVSGAGSGSKGGRPARWVASGGTAAGNEVARALDCDASGNVYTAGSLQGAVTFSGPANTAAMGGSAGAEDIFITKNAPDGSFVWARRYGGTGSDIAYDVSVASSGRLFVTGTFQGSFNMGAYTLSTPAGTTSTFTAELTAAGEVVWAGSTGAASSGSVVSNECGADDAGGIGVAGGFLGSAVFGAQTFSTGAGEQWGFIARYDAARTLTSLTVISGANTVVHGIAFAQDGTGDLLATGQFSGSSTFGNTTLTSAGESDAWLARLTSSGTWRSVRQAGGLGEDYGRGVTATPIGYATSGSFRGTATPVFGAGTLNSSGGRDVFVAKFDWNDSPQWLQRLGGSTDDEGAEISATPDGGLVLCGSFTGTLTFGQHTQTSGGARDLMVARLQSNGTPHWLAGALGGAGEDVGHACAVDGRGNVYFGGYYSTAAPFGYDVAVSPTMNTAPGQAEIVWGKIHATSEPNEDTDGDGQANAAELNSQTDPLDPASSLRITQIRREAAVDTISWQSVIGRSYRLQQSGDLRVWNDIATTVAHGVTTSAMVPAAGSRLFYRVATP